MKYMVRGLKYIVRGLLVALISLPLMAQAITINDVKVPDTHVLGSTTLLLNGAGLRKKAFFKLYVAGLYVPSASKNGNSIAAANESNAMRLWITSGLISSKKLTNATLDGFKLALNNDLSPLQKEVDQFLGALKAEPIEEGDVLTFNYEPATGTQVLHNSKTLTIVKGHAFKKALFSIWLGDQPADKRLKKGLLGL